MKMGQPDVPSRTEWLISVLTNGSVVGFDPFLISVQEFQSTEASLKVGGLKLVPTNKNIVDMVWAESQPLPNLTPLEPLGFQYTGRHVSGKLEEIQMEIKKVDPDAEAMILSSLDEIACKLIKFPSLIGLIRFSN